MIGYLGMLIRLALFGVAGALADRGIGSLDMAAGTFTLDLNAASQLIASAVLAAGTLAFSRWRKARGGYT